MQTSDLTDHISKRYNKDLEGLRNSVLTMDIRPTDFDELADNAAP